MSQPPKLWVFSSLVQDKEDPQQLIAYAIYKSHKEERAQRNKLAGMTDEQMKADLEKWHDDVAQDKRILESYEDKAFSIISAVIEGANGAAEHRQRQLISGLNADHATELTRCEALHQSECDALRKQVADAKEIAKNEWLEHVGNWTKVQNEPTGWRKALILIRNWVGGSISGALGGLFIVLIIGGLTTAVSTNARKAANTSLKKAVDVVLPETLYDTGTDSDSDVDSSSAKNTTGLETK